MTVGKVHLTKRYARYRIKNPSQFKKSTLRTHDIGRSGHSKRIAGKLKKNNRWVTQSILIARKDYKKGTRVKLKNGRPIIYIW
jgi:hypothetical protein